MANSKFKVGDRVYSPHFGKGIVSRIVDHKKADYPVEVHWIDIPPNSSYANEYYTLDGRFHTQYPDPEYDIILDEYEKTEFKTMDRVFYPFYGKGTVVGVWSKGKPYPIRVFWDDPPYKNEPWSSFTRDGVMSISRFVGADKVKLMLLKDISKEETGGSEVGQIESVITRTILQKEREKMHDEGRKFKVGDRVFSFYYGRGVVERIYKTESDPYPVVVRWDQD